MKVKIKTLVPLNVLRADVILARRGKCRGCPNVIMFPFPRHERVHSCKLLHDPAKPRRDPSHYLWLFVEVPSNGCPDAPPRWDAATEADLRRPDEAELKIETVYEVLWGEIHDPRRKWDEAFVRSIHLRLPCRECVEEFDAYCAAHWPPLGDDAACWAWGWELHNHIRTKQGKDTMSFEAFRRIYGPARI